MRVDVNGVGTEFEVTGEGRPVVLLDARKDASSDEAGQAGRGRQR